MWRRFEEKESWRSGGERENPGEIMSITIIFLQD